MLIFWAKDLSVLILRVFATMKVGRVLGWVLPHLLSDPNLLATPPDWSCQHAGTEQKEAGCVLTIWIFSLQASRLSAPSHEVEG